MSEIQSDREPTRLNTVSCRKRKLILIVLLYKMILDTIDKDIGQGRRKKCPR